MPKSLARCSWNMFACFLFTYGEDWIKYLREDANHLFLAKFKMAAEWLGWNQQYLLASSLFNLEKKTLVDAWNLWKWELNITEFGFMVMWNFLCWNRNVNNIISYSDFFLKLSSYLNVGIECRESFSICSTFVGIFNTIVAKAILITSTFSEKAHLHQNTLSSALR